MFWKIIKSIILIALILFYAQNLYNGRSDLYGAIVYNRLNFITIIAILYLLSDYIKLLKPLWILLFIVGGGFHAYKYYDINYNTPELNAVENSKADKNNPRKCREGEDSLYDKLNGKCY